MRVAVAMYERIQLGDRSSSGGGLSWTEFGASNADSGGDRVAVGAYGNEGQRRLVAGRYRRHRVDMLSAGSLYDAATASVSVAPAVVGCVLLLSTTSRLHNYIHLTQKHTPLKRWI